MTGGAGRETRASCAPRSAWAAGEVWLLTTTAHSVAGGSLPSLPWLLALAGLVTVASALVVRTSVSLRWLVPALIASQVALHQVLVSMAAAPAPDAHAMAGHAAAADALSSDLSWRMVLAHVVSGALTTVVWRLRRRAVDGLRCLALPIVVPAAAVARTTPMVELIREGLRCWRLGGPRRAPPRVPAAA